MENSIFRTYYSFVTEFDVGNIVTFDIRIDNGENMNIFI